MTEKKLAANRIKGRKPRRAVTQEGKARATKANFAIAALMAPKEENALPMQRMEDSSLRQLWRLTNILVKVRKGGLHPTEMGHEE